MCDAILVKHK